MFKKTTALAALLGLLCNTSAFGFLTYIIENHTNEKNLLIGVLTLLVAHLVQPTSIVLKKLSVILLSQLKVQKVYVGLNRLMLNKQENFNSMMLRV